MRQRSSLIDFAAPVVEETVIAFDRWLEPYSNSDRGDRVRGSPSAPHPQLCSTVMRGRELVYGVDQQRVHLSSAAQ